MCMRSKLRVIVITFVLLYLAAQIVMPKLGLAAIVNFDSSCYSGASRYLERANGPHGSSCGGSNTNFMGFPFVFNAFSNTIEQKLAVLVIDVLFGVAALVLLLYVLRRWSRTKNT